MPRVIINEIDRTQYNITTNESDNIVYVPGSAIKGPIDKPYLCKSLTDFTNLFGDVGTNPDELTLSSWEFASNLLLSGFPVLFRRIVGTYNSADDTYSLSDKASYKFTDGNDPAATQFTATAVLPGSLGNNIELVLSKTYTIESNAVTTAGYFRITVSDKFDETTARNYTSDTFEIGTTDTDLFDAVKAFILTIDDPDVKFTVETSFAIYDTWFDTPTDLVGGTDPTAASIMAWLGSNQAANAKDLFGELADKDLYDIKFATLGGMFASATSTEEQNAVKELVRVISEDRRDCLAVLDLPYTLDKDGDTDEVITYFNFLNEFDPTEGSSYACAYDPWFYFRVPLITKINDTDGKPVQSIGNKLVSGSFIFLFELAKSLKNGNPIWLPPAGVNRGLVPEAVDAYFEVGSVRAEVWSDADRKVNPIRKIRNYGYAIFGQKTLYAVTSPNTTSAFQDLSVRIIANEIKRKIRDISISLTFENNNLKTWNEFRAGLDPYLTSMAADGALDNYKIIMDSTTTTEGDINTNTVRGTVIVQIARAAENFNIDFIVTNSTAEFNESYV